MKENTEAFSGNELDDTVVEEVPMKENTEEISSNELGDTVVEEVPMKENTEEISGNELGDTVVEEVPTKENTEGISGNELGDTVVEEVPTINTEINSNSSVPQDSKEKNKFPLIRILLVLVLVLGISAIFMGRYFLGKKNLPEAVPATIPEVQLIKFDSFVIPYTGGNNYSYISLSASFYLPQEAVRLEMDEKKLLLRDTIYELISRQTQQSGRNPSLLQLKDLIRNAVNRKLSSGQVDELFITHYLVI